MRELVAQRHPLYSQADLTVESRDIAHDTIVEEILAGLSNGPLAADVARTEDAR
jgi:shikimate kinase